MEYDKNNVFYKIINKQIKAEIIAENKNAIAIKDISPRKKVHLLVIPKGEYKNIFHFNKSASKEEIFDLWNLVNEVCLKNQLVENGFRIIINQGENGGQEVPHLHVHILGGEKVGKMCD